MRNTEEGLHGRDTLKGREKQITSVSGGEQAGLRYTEGTRKTNLFSVEEDASMAAIH